jgi:exocyst complex component 6
VIGYMRSVFDSLGPMDDGLRAGLHFSCCGHVSERLVHILCKRPLEESISQIDAYGLKTLSKHVGEFKDFASTTGVPKLADTFEELKSITDAMLDAELATLLRPEHAEAHNRKYPYLSLERLVVCWKNIVEQEA